MTRSRSTSRQEAAYRQLMRALAAAGERGEALRVWERCRTTLVEELGVDPSPETEAVYLEVLGPGASPPTARRRCPSGVVTFLLTDIVESSALWDDAPGGDGRRRSNATTRSSPRSSRRTAARC